MCSYLLARTNGNLRLLETSCIPCAAVISGHGGTRRIDYALRDCFGLLESVCCSGAADQMSALSTFM